MSTVDLRSKRRVRSSGQKSYAHPRQVALATGGSIAYLSEEYQEFDSDPPMFTVAKVEADGETTLDSGTDIDPTSLALAGHRVYWTRGGVAHSAAIH